MESFTKFYCYCCDKEALGIIVNIQTDHGIKQCIVCPNCGNMLSLSLLNRINKKMEEIMNDALKSKIDPNTKFVVGSKEYNDYYFPKIDESGMHR